MKTSVVAGAAIAGLSSVAAAEDFALDDDSRLLFPIEDPIVSADANTDLYRSLTKSLDLGLGYLADESGVSDSVAGRLGEYLLALTLEDYFSVFSHELGHYRTNSLSGYGSVVRMEPFAWFIFHGGTVYSRDVPNGLVRSPFDNGGEGINQNTLNALSVWRETRSSVSLLDNISYINNRFVSTAYDIQENGRGDIGIYQKHLKGFALDALQDEYHERYYDAAYPSPPLGSPSWVISNWLYGLEQARDWHESEKASLNQDHSFPEQRSKNSLVLLALDFPLYESLYNVFDYIATGDRHHVPFSFSIGDLEVFPPSTQHFLTSKGEFANVELFAKYDDLDFSLSVGRDLDWRHYLNHVDCMRIAASAKVPFDDFILYASGSVNFSTDWQTHFKGGSLGLGIYVPITNGFGLRADGLFSEDDIINNDVKALDNGISARVRLTYDFGG